MIAVTKLLCCLFIFSNFALVFSRVGFKAQVTTWNVNEKPPVSNIEDLIQIKESPDFYAFTFQEVNPKANPLSKNDDRWVAALKQSLSNKGFDLVDSKSIDGSLTAVFAKSTLKSDITNVDTASKRTGQLNIIGNKGATAVRFDYKGQSIVFVGAHFHAHDDQVSKRIDDYNNIINGISFSKGKAKKIIEHDNVFWSGDLNFRIDGLRADQIASIVKDKPLSTAVIDLMNKDQLKNAMKQEQIFQGFVEGTATFKPTYKYKIGTNDYNLERKPAFTDRVLYRLKSGAGRVVSYTANESFQISDHKPVTALIAVD
ncbi:inositol polyphosphate 5-phosphatase K-like protein [Leptotrombidium deliense]|uniref:Inositol polyphosphate 5-phosphatase K-like protein n=1 Tax=Leptotrombidium deliense TaxID=299467 RepID=A0A443SDW2_9ACAR|nr:inositol polyphosphate 5-phosphatase K-like protein [Leptotrombidium deliense]